MADGAIHITVRGSITTAEADSALRLGDAAAAVDGTAALSEDARLHVRYGGDPSARNVFLRRSGELAGFAHLRPGADGGWNGELVVHPRHRGHGLGLLLARTVLAQSAGAVVRLWAHGDLPAAARLAAAAGFTRSRGLWLMRLVVAGEPAAPRLPTGVTLRTFTPGHDEQAWLELNARAFAHHPEQGRWTRVDLARREREPWFDPAGFFLAERDGQLVGFHWTKLHTSGPDRVGEVYIVGTDPSAQGIGLGKALTLAGLRYLRARGAGEVILYVDESNLAAIGMYRRLGFSRAGIDVMYQHPGERATPADRAAPSGAEP